MKDKIRETVRDIIEEDFNTPAVGYFWKGLALFLLGVIIGFSMAPVKKGIKIGCNNGNNCTDSGKITGSGNPFCKGTKKDAAEDDEQYDCGDFCAD